MTEKEKSVSTTNSAPAAWLTQEAFDRLKAELDHLSGAGRAEIVQKIEAARQEGDLKENGGYHAAKEEQGKIEARIRQLTALLRDAHVGEAPADDGIVEPGMIVVARIAGDEETFLLGSREIAGDSDLDVFSEKSPLGAAIVGHKEGERSATPRPTARTSRWKSSPPSLTRLAYSHRLNHDAGPPRGEAGVFVRLSRPALALGAARAGAQQRPPPRRRPPRPGAPARK